MHRIVARRIPPAGPPGRPIAVTSASEPSFLSGPGVTVARAGRVGVNAVALTRLRIGARTLAVGAYRVTMVATVPGAPAVRVSRALAVRPAPTPVRRAARAA